MRLRPLSHCALLGPAAGQKGADRLAHAAEDGAARDEHDQRDEREQREHQPERLARQYARPLFFVVIALFSRITQNDFSLPRAKSRFQSLASLYHFSAYISIKMREYFRNFA